MLRHAGLLVVLSACASTPRAADPAPSFDGRWRVVFDTELGPLPVPLHIAGDQAWFENGPEHATTSAVITRGDTLELEIAWYESKLVARRDGDRLVGEWSKPMGDDRERVEFVATRHEGPRFDPLPPNRSGPATVDDITGEWAATIDVAGTTFEAYGAVRVEEGEVRAIFFTPYGETRLLVGDFDRGILRLSRFEGSHVGSLFMEAQPDGSLAGVLWRSDGYSFEMTMKKSAAPTLPDPYAITALTSDDGRLDFAFPDRSGAIVTAKDERFEGRVVVVDIFGTWCPNCWEQADVLAEWARRYGERGLVVVGVAFEETEDPARAWKQIALFEERTQHTYPILLASADGGEYADELLADITNVVSFPTTVFIGRDGRVRRIHSGFIGPARPELFEAQVKEQEALLERLLAE